MPLTTLPHLPGYNPRGTRRYLWIPLEAMPDGVLDTAALGAATDVTNQMAVMPSGFTTSQARVPDPDVGSLVTGTIAGEVTYDDTTMTFKLAPTGPGDDIRAVLHEGDEGFFAIANEGLVAGRSADVVRSSIGYGGKLNEDVARYQLPVIVNSIETDVVIPTLPV